MIFLTLLMMAIGTITCLSLVLVGLVEAPWPILLLLLVSGLYGLQRLSTQMKNLADVPAAAAPLPPAIGGEELKYRGACYTPEPTAATQTPNKMSRQIVYRGCKVAATPTPNPADRADVT